ncbi:MAG: acetyl-CoA C-acyltransferase [Acidimicrobiia bacterium]|nr:acetyl-CoA C-acyltransferase [Acidimicrobiia bacterium]MDH4363335.1 acetyl-CoA C-acyltransferase [Acidimicrobiia bacterium]MDH5289291.1 acetyl-CoA C-acyltransferase [Acidimicrobiia bacterium]
MREAVFVSYARTGLAKAARGGFNMTPAMTMAAHAVKHAVEKSGVEPEAVEDFYLGNGAHGAGNLGRLAGLLAGLPVTTGGATVQRHCSSGLNSIALAANYIRNDGADVVVAGGVESISIPSPGFGGSANMDSQLTDMYPAIYMAMIETADIVAERYKVSREYQDEYSLQSQQRMASAQERGLFEDEIVPMDTKMRVVNRETGEESIVDAKVVGDECNRPDTTLEGLAKLKPVRGEGKFITAGNASQLSDGAAAVVMMSDEEAARRNLEPMGAFRGWAVAGCEPDEMGIGPVFAVPKLLKRHGLTVEDIDLWELNEAFASQCLYSRDTLGIDPEKYNVNGGSIAIGHPFGMTGTRCAGHILQEGRRRGARWGVVTMCIGGGQGAAGLVEIYN